MTSTTLTSTFRTALCLIAVCTLTAPAAAGARDLRSPDARDAAHGRNLTAPTGCQDMRSPDARAAARAASEILPVSSKPAGSASGGLDWPSAGIGAVMLGGLLLIGYAASGVVRHIRTRATA